MAETLLTTLSNGKLLHCQNPHGSVPHCSVHWNWFEKKNWAFKNEYGLVVRKQHVYFSSLKQLFLGLKQALKYNYYMQLVLSEGIQ